MSAKYYIIEFKGYHRNYYYNYLDLPLKKGEYAIVQAERGEDMGRIVRSLTVNEAESLLDDNLPNILRVAGKDDLDRLRFNRQKEEESFEECLHLIGERELNMKLVDVEYQFDCNKITFYFTADKRIDFRELVKDLASIYRTRIELRQIGVRDEAKRMGGYGCCGLPQCCSNWLNDFKPISTQLARDQNLSLNPSKISGNCGRLLCCLLYEQPIYEQLKSKFPSPGSKCEVCPGNATVINIDIFNNKLICRYDDGYEEKLPLREYRKRLRLKERGKLKKEIVNKKNKSKRH